MTLVLVFTLYVFALRTKLIGTNLIVPILFDSNGTYKTDFICPSKYICPDVLSVWGTRITRIKHVKSVSVLFLALC